MSSPRLPLLAFVLLAHLPAASAPVTGGAEPLAWRFAHPEAQVLAGVNLAQLAASPAGLHLRSQFAAALGPSLIEQAEMLLLSSVDIAGGKRADVLILSGNLTLANLRRMAMKEGARISSYKTLEIAAPAGARAEDPHLAWQSAAASTVVLIGTRPAVQAAYDRSRAHLDSLESVNPIFKRARTLRSQFPVWVACEGIPLGAGPKAVSLLSEDESENPGWVEGLDIAFRFDQSPAANFTISTTNEATAEVVLQKLRDSAAAAEPFLLKPWLSNLKGELDGGTLTLASPLDDPAASARVAPLLAAFGLPVDAAPPPATPAVAVEVRAKVSANVPAHNMPSLRPDAVTSPPAPPKKLFVRISGLDEGTRTIPYGSNR
jgi:hypothetical protein